MTRHSRNIKTLPLFIPATFMFLILAVLLVFMCLPQNQSRIKASGGILDARYSTEIIPLHGEWEFIYGELLTPDMFEQPQTIIVPGSWDSEGHPLNGRATYRLTILTEEQAPLMLFLPEISSAYTLWVNGERVRSCGTVAEVAHDGNPHFDNALIPISAKNSMVEIVMQISNYHFIYGGINDTILLGESEALLAWYLQTRALSCIAMGCILMAAFYHLSLYMYRRHEKTYLLFALLCFLCFLRFLLETNGLNEYFGWIPMNIFGMRFYLTLFFLHSIAIIAFSLYIFAYDFLRKHRLIIGVYLSAILIANLLMPLNTTAYLIVTTAFTTPFFVFLLIIAARSPVLRESGATRLYYTALIIYFIVGTSSKLFLDNVLFMPGLITNMFMVMSQSLVLSRRYTDAFHFVEETNQNLEQIVDERTQSLQDTNVAMKELVSNISHDLKTPLAVMSLNLETLTGLAMTKSDADYQRHVRIAYQKNRDLQRLIQNLFEVSRIETGRSLYLPEWVSILPMLAQAWEKYETFLEDQGLSFDINAEDDIEISADPQKIWSVFDNIIYNAVRYTVNGGITITVANKDTSAVMTITDTGCGIAPEHLPHIFKRFYRGSAARSTNEGESGLGLYIVKSVMDGCGGSVEAESEQGKRTSIILTFPARRQP